MRSFFVAFLLLIATSAFSQYWFGPKAGIIYNDHIFQERAYKDTFDISNNLNFQGGFAFAYTATDTYSAYGEIVYERVGFSLRDKQTNGNLQKVDMTNHFISVPVMFRVTLGKGYLKYYANGGPRLSFWLGGEGEHDLDESDEPAVFGRDEDGNALPYPFKVTFNSSKRDEDQRDFVDQPNRLQFGLALGGGVLYDLPNGSRIMIDFRLTWSHSNMAQNSEDDELQFSDYRLNWEYSRNYAGISIGYLIGYNADLKRKGGSTSAESNKKKK